MKNARVVGDGRRRVAKRDWTDYCPWLVLPELRARMLFSCAGGRFSGRVMRQALQWWIWRFANTETEYTERNVEIVRFVMLLGGLGVKLGEQRYLNEALKAAGGDVTRYHVGRETSAVIFRQETTTLTTTVCGTIVWLLKIYLFLVDIDNQLVEIAAQCKA